MLVLFQAAAKKNWCSSRSSKNPAEKIPGAECCSAVRGLAGSCRLSKDRGMRRYKGASHRSHQFFLGKILRACSCALLLQVACASSGRTGHDAGDRSGHDSQQETGAKLQAAAQAGKPQSSLCVLMILRNEEANLR
jgi:hypothetical protein